MLDDDKQLYYHVAPGGFRCKVMDIVLALAIGVVFAAIVIYQLISLAAGKWMTARVAKDSKLEIWPLQEIPQFCSTMYHIRSDVQKKSKKKSSSSNIDQSKQGRFECILCDFCLERGKN